MHVFMHKPPNFMISGRGSSGWRIVREPGRRKLPDWGSTRWPQPISIGNSGLTGMTGSCMYLPSLFGVRGRLAFAFAAGITGRRTGKTRQNRIRADLGPGVCCGLSFRGETYFCLHMSMSCLACPCQLETLSVLQQSFSLLGIL